MPAHQPDLFAPPLLPGLALGEEIVSAEEEAAVIGRLETVALAPFKFQGWVGKRLTTSFGWHYDFEDARLAPTEPIPEWLAPLRARAAAFAGLEADTLVQVLLTRYDPGAGIGWHRDRPVFEHVVGISLGVAATMRFRRRRVDGFDRFSADLGARSIYHLSGAVRHEWEHSIAEMDATRWSVTFRTLSAKGARQR